MGAENKQQIKKVLAELQQEIDPAPYIERKWPEYWISAFDQPWKPSTPGDTISKLLLRFQSDEETPFYLIVRDNGAGWAKDSAERTAAISLSVLCNFLFGQTSAADPNPAAQLPKILRFRQDILPVAEGDVLTLRIIRDAANGLDSRPELPVGQLADWIDLSKAANPVYRMIALHVFGEFRATGEQQRAFYSSYLYETELGINKELLEQLTRNATPWALSVAQQLKAKLAASE